MDLWVCEMLMLGENSMKDRISQHHHPGPNLQSYPELRIKQQSFESAQHLG